MENRRLNPSRHPLQPNGPLVGGTWLLSARINHSVDPPMNYYKRHLGDYAKDTAHLSMLEHGAYTLLMDRYYATETGIPEDQAYRITRSSSKQERAAVDAVLKEFFYLRDGVWIKDRCESEIAEDREFIEQQRGKAAKRWANRGKAAVMPEHMPRHEPGIDPAIPPTPTPTPISKSGSAASTSDPRKQLFDLGKTILGSDAGSLIAKALKHTDEPTVGAILGEMALRPKADPRSYFAKMTMPKAREVVV